MGIGLGPDDWAIRCNLIYIQDGRLTDFTAGHITSPEGQSLLESLQAGVVRALIEFHPGVSYRNLMIYRGRGKYSPFGDDTVTDPPHDHPDQPVAEHLPRGPGCGFPQILDGSGSPSAREPPCKRGQNRRGETAGECDLALGTGKGAAASRIRRSFTGSEGPSSRPWTWSGAWACWPAGTRLDVPGATGYLDTDYAAKGRAAIDAIRDYDLVCVHVEAPDEASHEGRARRQGRSHRADRSRDRRSGPRSTAVSRPLADRDFARSFNASPHPCPRPRCAVTWAMAGTGLPRLGQALRRIRGPRSGMPVLRSGLQADAAIPGPRLGRADGA